MRTKNRQTKHNINNNNNNRKCHKGLMLSFSSACCRKLKKDPPSPHTQFIALFRCHILAYLYVRASATLRAFVRPLSVFCVCVCVLCIVLYMSAVCLACAHRQISEGASDDHHFALTRRDRAPYVVFALFGISTRLFYSILFMH